MIEMCDDPGEIIKSKKDCSMAEGLRRVAAGKGTPWIGWEHRRSGDGFHPSGQTN